MEEKLATRQKRAAIYVRVSTDEQGKPGHYGPEIQREKCIEYCNARGYEWNDKGIFSDIGISGSLELVKRPAFSELYDDALLKKYDVVVVYKYDRMARDLRISMEIRRSFKVLKIDVESCSEQFEQDTPMGDSMVNLMGWLADVERKTIRERTYSGRIAAAKKGRWVTGLPPYGYKIIKETKKLEIVPLEAEVVKQFYEWLVYEKLTLRELQRRANASGLPTPKHLTIKSRTTSNFWHTQTIGRILTNEIYAGRAHFRKYKRPFRNLSSHIEEERQRPKDDWIPFDSPPIISKELFEGSLKQLQRNREDSVRNTKRSYMYTKLLRCGTCGYKMFSGYSKPKVPVGDESKGRYYHGIQKGKTPAGKSKRCESCPCYAEFRLSPIWETLKEILQNPENLHEPLTRYKYKVEDKGTIERKIAVREKEIEAIEGKLGRLVSLFLDEELMDVREFKSREQEYRKSLANLENEISKLKQGLVSRKDDGNREKILKKLCKQIQERLERASYEDKKLILHLFVESITLYAKSNYAEVVFKFPTSTVITNATLEVSQESIPLFLTIKTLPYQEARVRIRERNLI